MDYSCSEKWVEFLVHLCDCMNNVALIDSPGGWHGYWAQDLYAVNENYGSSDDLKSLVNAAHDKVGDISWPLH